MASFVPRPSPAPLLGFKGHLCSQQKRVGNGLGMRLHNYITCPVPMYRRRDLGGATGVETRLV